MDLTFSNSFTAHIVDGINHILPLLPNALFDLLVGILIIRIFVHVARFVMKITNIQPALRDVVSSILETIMWMLLAVALLNELGFSGIIYFFTGSIAAVGLAMAAGGSTLISDIVAGVFLARDRDFNIGDEVEILLPSGNTTQGRIESMDSRRTRLRDDEGLLHIIPNSVVERNEWIVHDKRPGLGTLVKATKAVKHVRKVARQKRAARVERKERAS